MFLLNYYRLLSLNTIRVKTTQVVTYRNGSTAEVYDEYTVRNGCATVYGKTSNDYNSRSPLINRVRGTSAYGGVVFGDGVEPPTFTDYWLSGNEITSFNETHTETVEWDSTIKGTRVTVVYTITNTGDTDFTIGEVALLAKPWQVATGEYEAIVERTVLDTPVTISPGGVGQVTYSVAVIAPTAPTT